MPWGSYDDDYDEDGVYRWPLPSIPPEEIDSGYDSDEDADSYTDERGPIHDLAMLLRDGPAQLTEFSFGGAATWLPAVSGLAIEGLGPIALPIVDAAQAEAISRVSKQGPAAADGRPLEVDGWKLNFRNSKWDEGIKSAAALIEKRYGVSGIALSSQVSRLMLFRPGDSMARNASTNSGPREFATLTIQLHSEGAGAHLFVYKSGRKEPIKHRLGDEDGDARFEPHYAVHPYEAEWAYSQVTSGYRLSVEYTILWPEDVRTKPSLALPEDLEIQLVKALSRIEQAGRVFFHLFNDHYEEKDIDKLGCRVLSLSDGTIFSTLRRTNEALGPSGFDFFIVKADYQRTDLAIGRDFEDAEWDEDEDDLVPTIKRVWTCEGKRVGATEDFDWRFGTQLVRANLLNSQGKMWMEAWAGHRVTSFDVDGHLLFRHKNHHKVLLVAFPKRTAKSKMMEIAGEIGALELLLASGSAPPVAPAGAAASSTTASATATIEGTASTLTPPGVLGKRSNEVAQVLAPGDSATKRMRT